MISEPEVRRLVAEQFPQWAHLPLTPAPAGTDHMMFRLGDALVVRLPRPGHADTAIAKEHRWLPVLAPALPLDVPEPVGLGRPTPEHPAPWSVYRWLDGDHDLSDLPHAAVALGRFVAALSRVDPADAPPAYRGGPVKSWDDGVRAALRDLPAPGAAELWDAALRLPQWDGPPVWTHSDLLPTNLLARDGRLSAVIDFACAGVGDPASDLMAAWTVFDAGTRPLFRAQLDVDDATWERGRAWALAFGLSAWHYYPTRDPSFAELGRRTVEQTLADASG